MKGRETQTYFCVSFEAAAFGQENNVRWLEGIFGRKDEPSVIDPASKICVVSAKNSEVPVKWNRTVHVRYGDKSKKHGLLSKKVVIYYRRDLTIRTCHVPAGMRGTDRWDQAPVP